MKQQVVNTPGQAHFFEADAPPYWSINVALMSVSHNFACILSSMQGMKPCGTMVHVMARARPYTAYQLRYRFVPPIAQHPHAITHAKAPPMIHPNPPACAGFAFWPMPLPAMRRPGRGSASARCYPASGDIICQRILQSAVQHLVGACPRIMPFAPPVYIKAACSG